MNPATEKLVIALCILVPLVVMINLGLWAAFRQRNSPVKNRFAGRASSSLSRSWDNEDRLLKELSASVKDLSGAPGPVPDSSPQPPDDRSQNGSE